MRFGHPAPAATDSLGANRVQTPPRPVQVNDRRTAAPGPPRSRSPQKADRLLRCEPAGEEAPSAASDASACDPANWASEIFEGGRRAFSDRAETQPLTRQTVRRRVVEMRPQGAQALVALCRAQAGAAHLAPEQHGGQSHPPESAPDRFRRGDHEADYWRWASVDHSQAAHRRRRDLPEQRRPAPAVRPRPHRGPRGIARHRPPMSTWKAARH